MLKEGEFMSEQIIMLGTGNAMVTKCYNTCFVLKSNNECFLVDAGGGNGILNQIVKAKIEWSSIKNMFVTHSHTDHILGVIWVIRKISSLMLEDKYDGDFNIYCHNECAQAINSICRVTLAKKFLKCMEQHIFIHTVENGDKILTKNIKLTAFDIFSDKTKQFGFNVVFPSGKTLVCLGDEPYNKQCKKYVFGKDYIMCEAFCLFSQREIFKPYEKFHSTALDAGKLAQSLNVKNLVLYHTEDKNLDTRKKSYTDEASTVFSGNIFVPDDLEILNIK